MCRQLAVLLLCCHGAAGFASGGRRLTIAIDLHRPPYVVVGSSVAGLQVEIIKAALPGHDLTFLPMPDRQYGLAVTDGVADAAKSVHTPGMGSPEAEAAGQFYSADFIGFVNFAFSRKSAALTLREFGDLEGASAVLTWEGADGHIGGEFTQLFSEGGPRRHQYHEYSDQGEQVRAFWEDRTFDHTAVAICDGLIFEHYSPAFARGAVDELVDQWALFDANGTITARLAFASAADRDEFDAGLAAICASGEYDRLLQKYDADAMHSTCPRLPSQA